MTKQELVYYHNLVWKKYHRQMIICFDQKNPDSFKATISEKIVHLPIAIKTDQSEWSLFAFLHEIGHILTNTTQMKRCEQEYLATQWALDESKKLGFKVAKETIVKYQYYIYRWRWKGIRLNGKNMPTEDDLKLKY